MRKYSRAADSFSSEISRSIVEGLITAPRVSSAILNPRQWFPGTPKNVTTGTNWGDVKELLEERGCQALATTSAAEGLQFFDANAVDLVLLDYHMPEMMGDVVAGLMRASKSDVPIAMLSSDDGIAEYVLGSVDAFVSKSESVANFLQIVEQLLNLRVLFAPLDSAGEGAEKRAA